MLNLKKLLLLTGASAVIALTGCESTSSSQSTGGRSEGTKIDDKTITETVIHDLNREPVYKFPDVQVKTFDGVVQLSGFVFSEAQRQRAGQIAQHTEGAAQVVNNITLKPMTPTGRPPERYYY